MRQVRTYRRILSARMAPKRIWQAVLAVILLIGIYLFLPTSEIAIARTWLETFLGRLR